MNEASHFANFNLPPHTWYRKNEISDTTFHIYDWQGKATCSFEEGAQSFIVNDYTIKPFYTTIHKSLEKVIETLRLIFMPMDNDRFRAGTIHTLYMTVKEVERRIEFYKVDKPLSLTTQTFLEYYGYTVNKDKVTISHL